MKNTRTLLLAILLMASYAASAQYTQQRPNTEFMFKVEAGYLHSVGNYGKPEIEAVDPADTPSGYRLNLHEEAAGLNVMAGANISQDFFLGGGLGYAYCIPFFKGNVDYTPSHMAHLFVDMDYRPVGDTWAPMVGARLGGSFLMNPNNYGNTIAPLAEVYGGLNWFYDHALQQMDRNYHSLFVETGVQFTQGSVFIPIRVGWRW